MGNENEYKPTVVHAACKRGSDQLTEGQRCDSTTAERLSPPGSLVVSFRCVKCKHQWNVPLGGGFTTPV